MFSEQDESERLRSRLEMLQERLDSIRAGRRILMDLLASQMKEKRILSERIRRVERSHRRNTLRCLRLEVQLRSLSYGSGRPANRPVNR